MRRADTLWELELLRLGKNFSEFRPRGHSLGPGGGGWAAWLPSEARRGWTSTCVRGRWLAGPPALNLCWAWWATSPDLLRQRPPGAGDLHPTGPGTL